MNIIIPADWIETGAIAAFENYTDTDWDTAFGDERAQWLSDTDACLAAVVPLVAAQTLRQAIAALDDDAWGLEDETADGMDRAGDMLRAMLEAIEAAS